MLLIAVGSLATTARAQQAAPGTPAQASVGTAWELAVRRAQEHIQYGLSLGGRQAVYSAQSEFLQALRVIARELDVAAGAREHEAALADGWRALETLEYVKAPEGVGDSPDHHRAFQAMQRQLGYAQERLATSGDHEPTASMALYALGRSCLAIAEECPDQGPLCAPKALALYQAALAVDPRNSLAINELALLLARCGQLAEGERVLVRGVAVNPQPQLWHNLAVLHEKMGRADWAAEDRRRRDALAALQQRQGSDASAAMLTAVRWVEPAEFVRCSGSDDLGKRSPDNVAASPPKQVTPDPATPATKSTPLVQKWVTNLLYPDLKSGEQTDGQCPDRKAPATR